MNAYGVGHDSTIAAYVIFVLLFLAGLLWLLLQKPR